MSYWCGPQDAGPEEKETAMDQRHRCVAPAHERLLPADAAADPRDGRERP